MRKIIKKLRMFFILLGTDWELSRAIRLAEKKYLKRGVRFYVIPDMRHRLVSRSYGELKKMRKAGMFSHRATEKDFTAECFYYTASRFGDRISAGRKKRKRLEWLNYVVQVRGL